MRNNVWYHDLMYCTDCHKIFHVDAISYGYRCPTCHSKEIKRHDDSDAVDTAQMINNLSALWHSLEKGNLDDLEVYKPIYLAMLNRATEFIKYLDEDMI